MGEWIDYSKVAIKIQLILIRTKKLRKFGCQNHSSNTTDTIMHRAVESLYSEGNMLHRDIETILKVEGPDKEGSLQ